MSVSEFLAPSLIILGLFLLNAAALFFILRARRKQEFQNHECMDMEIGPLDFTRQ